MNTDFQIFWTAGFNLLHGLDPYIVKGNFYPPATNLFFALFALIPINLSFLIWRGLGASLFFYTIWKNSGIKYALIWFAYVPTLFLLLSGQPDIFFLWLFSFINRKGWIAALAASFLTLKPQIALIALPWYLLYWLLNERKTLFWFFGFTALLILLPIGLDPTFYQRWMIVTYKVATVYVFNSPGIFSLTIFPIPLGVFYFLGFLITIYGLYHGRMCSLPANFLATPVGTWYNTILLAGTIPWQLLIPVSWIAFGFAAAVKAAYPLSLIPVVAFLWMIVARKKSWIEEDRLPLPSFIKHKYLHEIQS